MSKAEALREPPSFGPGEGTGDPVDLGRFLGLTLQLALLVYVVYHFQLETELFYRTILPLTGIGFAVHYFMPRRHRLAFFIGLSWLGIHLALGFPNSLLVIGLALLLIFVCRLRAPFSARVGLVAAIAVGLALLRLDRFATSWSGSVLPVLAAMFMFRIILYLHHLRHHKDAGLQHALAYFFLLPNIAFPVFPIVDYATFGRTYYDSDRHAIHQKGIRWMLVGITQLFLYRYVYQFWMVAPEDIADLRSLMQYGTTNYLLILRAIGQYNLVVGILHLFGFNLPPIVDKLFLAPSFTDFWRRANAYWKDFMQKVFFYPLYFRLKKLHPRLNLVLSTVFVFVVTWLAHGYQSFWIKGSYRVTLPDVLFWTAFGLCVTVSALRESMANRKRTLAGSRLSLGGAAAHALRAMLMFASVAVMYSLWTSPSVSDWAYIWFDTPISLADVVGAVPILLLAFAVFLAAILLFEQPQRGPAESGDGQRVPLFRRAGLTAASSAFLFLLGTPLVSLPGNGEAPAVILALQGARLNAMESELLTRGYYEDLNDASQFSATHLGELYVKRQGIAWPSLRETEAARESNTFLGDSIVPSVNIVFHGAPITTNRWGMRDRDYEQRKPEGTYRIALLGHSSSFGSGVADHETFEAVLEERLNAERPGSYEILNFSVPGYSLLQQLALLESRVLEFEPDAVLLVASTRDDTGAARHLANVVKKRIEIPYDFLREIVREAEVDAELPFEQGFRRLKRRGKDMLLGIYPRFTKICRERGIVPYYGYMPNIKETVKQERDPETDAQFMGLAQQAGFEILDVSDAFANQDISTLRVAPWDWHPNARGHKLLADRLYEALGRSEIAQNARHAPHGE
jgi:hypothetical protein